MPQKILKSRCLANAEKACSGVSHYESNDNGKNRILTTLCFLQLVALKITANKKATTLVAFSISLNKKATSLFLKIERIVRPKCAKKVVLGKIGKKRQYQSFPDLKFGNNTAAHIFCQAVKANGKG